MTAKKDFKRLVRALAKQTGKSYVDALRHFRQTPPEAPPMTDPAPPTTPASPSSRELPVTAEVERLLALAEERAREAGQTHLTADCLVPVLLEQASGATAELLGRLGLTADAIRTALGDSVEPGFLELVHGHAEVRLVVRSGRGEAIVGCHVRDGRVQRGAGARVTRGGQIVYNGHIAALKRFKGDVLKVNAGQECGMRLENWSDPKEGDVIEVYGPAWA